MRRIGAGDQRPETGLRSTNRGGGGDRRLAHPALPGEQEDAHASSLVVALHLGRSRSVTGATPQEDSETRSGRARRVRRRVSPRGMHPARPTPTHPATATATPTAKVTAMEVAVEDSLRPDSEAGRRLRAPAGLERRPG